MNGVVAHRSEFCEPILPMLEAAYAEFGELTGRHYGLLSKYRCDDAETVFVSLGSAAENIEAAVDYLRAKGEKAGSIHVNVLRPSPEAAFVAALAGKKNVIVLERTDQPLAGDNPLARDIRTAFTKAVAGRDARGRRRPSLLLRHLRPRLARLPARGDPRRVRVRHGLARPQGRPHRGRRDDALRRRHRPPLRGEGRRAAVAAPPRRHRRAPPLDRRLGNDHDRQEPGRDHRRARRPRGRTRRGRGRAGAAEGSRPRPANPKYGSEKKGAPTEYFLVVAPERIRVNCDLRHVTVVLCCDPKAFTHTNPLDGMDEGRRLRLGVGREPRDGLDADPAEVPAGDPRQEDPRLHPARLRHRPRRHRAPRPAAPHAGQRLPRRVLRASRPSSRSSGSTATTSTSRSRSSTGRSSAASATPSSPRT